MPEKKEHDPYMCDYEREVFEALGQEFKYSPREQKIIAEYEARMEEQRKEILADLYKYKKQIGFQVHHTLNIMIEKWEEK